MRTFGAEIDNLIDVELAYGTNGYAASWYQNGVLREINVSKAIVHFIGSKIPIGNVLKDYIEIETDYLDFLEEDAIQLNLSKEDSSLTVGTFHIAPGYSKGTYVASYTAYSSLIDLSIKLDEWKEAPESVSIGSIVHHFIDAIGITFEEEPISTILFNAALTDFANMTLQELLGYCALIEKCNYKLVGNVLHKINVSKEICKRYDIEDVVYSENLSQRATDKALDFIKVNYKGYTTETDEDGVVNYNFADLSYVCKNDTEQCGFEVSMALIPCLETEFQTLLDTYYQSMKGMDWNDYSISFLGDARIEVGDLLEFYSGSISAKVGVAELTWEWDGALKCTVSSGSESASGESGSSYNLSQIVSQIQAMGNALRNVQFNTVYANELRAKVAELGYASIKELTAEVAKMGLMTAEEADIKYLTAEEADIKYLTAESAALKYATIDKLSALQGNFNTLNAKAITTENLKSEIANIGYLTATEADLKYLTVDTAKVKYATIDLSNIKSGTITTAMIATGAISTAQIADGSITDAKIVGLTANKITAGTLDAATIEVVNLNAANITVGTINGQQIASGTITLDNLGSDVTNKLVDTEEDVAKAVADAKQAILDSASANSIAASANSTASTANTNANTALSTANTASSNASTALSTANTANTNAANAVNTVNSMEIGGRNLCKNSDTRKLHENSNGGTFSESNVEDTEAVSGRHTEVTCTGSGGGYYFHPYFCIPNKKYTWSFWGKCSVGKGITLGIENGGVVDVAFTTEWKKYSHTFTANGNVYCSFIWYTSWQAGETLYIRDFKLEEGDKATTWTPAPEDIYAEIDAASIVNWCKDNNTLYIDGSKLYAGTVLSDAIAANAIVSDKIASGAVIATKIAAGAINTDKLAANAVTAAKIATETITATQIAASTITGAKIATGTIAADNIASAAITTDKLVANAVTAAKVAAEAITTDKLAANAVTAAKIAAGTITSAQINTGDLFATTAFANAVGANSVVVSNTNAINNMQIGGRNLCKNSDTRKLCYETVGGTFSESNVEDTEAVSRRRTEITCTGSGGGYYFRPYACIPNKKYTWSFWGKCSVGKGITLGIENGGVVDVAFTTEWKKYSHTFTANGNVYCSFIWYTSWQAGETLYIRDFKLEEGDKATTWTPAPEDIYAEIAEQGISNWCYNNDTTYINGGKIYTGTITAAQIASNAVTAEKVAAGAITTDKIAAKAITAAKIDVADLFAQSVTAKDMTITGGSIDIERSATVNATYHDYHLTLDYSGLSFEDVNDATTYRVALKATGLWFGSLQVIDYPGQTFPSVQNIGDVETYDGISLRTLNTNLNKIGTLYSAGSNSNTSISSNVGTALYSVSLPAGTYIIIGNACFASNATGRRQANILNEAGYTATGIGAKDVVVQAASSGATILTTTNIAKITTTTTYYLNVYQNSGSALGVRGSLVAIRIA